MDELRNSSKVLKKAGVKLPGLLTNSKISIIVRFKNESQYLKNVFESIRKQEICFPIEVISVNNNSADDSRAIAIRYSDKIIDIDHYEPGKALNTAIGKSSGSIIVILSAHAIPGNRHWLKNLISPFLVLNSDEEPIATYGAQIYPYYSQFLDKRDLDIFNFANCRNEYSDTDFWNANSAFRRKTWELINFSESVYELEDHFWTKNILTKIKGYVFFNPDAYVYHYGHDKRIDRKYPNIPSNHHLDFLKKAHKYLSTSSRWSDIMWAALICNSVSKNLIAYETIDILGKHLVSHWDFDVRWRIAQTLGNVPGKVSISYLSKALADSSFYARNEAAWSLRKLLPFSLSHVYKVFTSSTGEEKLYAAFVLGASKDEFSRNESFTYLIKLLINGSDLDVLKSLYIIGEIVHSPNSLNTVPFIKNIIRTQNLSEKTISIAIWCLGRIYEIHTYDFPLAQVIKFSKEHYSFLVRYESINAIGRYLNKNPILKVIKEINKQFFLESDNRVKYAICQTIRLLNEKKICNTNIANVEIVEIDDFGVMFEYYLFNKSKQ